MEFIKPLFPYIYILNNNNDNNNNMLDLRNIMIGQEKDKKQLKICYVCKKRVANLEQLELRQCKTMRRITDELIETHYICKNCIARSS